MLMDKRQALDRYCSEKPGLEGIGKAHSLEERVRKSFKRRAAPFQPNWPDSLTTAVQRVSELAGIAQEQLSRIVKLERDVQSLKLCCERLQAGQAIIVPITTLAPDPFDLRHDIKVVIQPSDGEFIATYFDANIATGGDTQEEAFMNLKMLIVDMYESLVDEKEPLGPEPERQLAVLKSVISRRRQDG
jgi:predicted RNase H-like HicB family nuclease